MATGAGPACGGVRTLFRLQRTIVALLFLSFVCGMVLGISLVTNTDLGTGMLGLLRSEKQGPPGSGPGGPTPTKTPPGLGGKTARQLGARLRPDTLEKNATGRLGNLEQLASRRNRTYGGPKVRPRDSSNEEDDLAPRAKFPPPNYNVHAFYYPWYGTPKTDGRWMHWGHEYMAHWDKKEAARWPTGRHQPPDDIGSSFYPALGPYSSKDPDVLDDHMKQIRSAGIGVIAVSWYPPNQADKQGHPWDSFLPLVFDKADQYQVKVCLHIEPYEGRNQETLRENLKYITGRYGKHPAFYRHTYHGRSLPLYYIYDSYLTKADNWAKLLGRTAATTVRHTDLDAIFIGLLVEEKHKEELITAGFDGFYTYFASDGFTFGSSTRNWPALSAYASSSDAMFIPSVGPGYVDVRVRPWNSRNTKDREQGGYFEQSFKAAIGAKPSIITITSFNEWHEGTQIEKAVTKKTTGYQYSDYSPQQPDYYLMLTRKWVHKYKRHEIT